MKGVPFYFFWFTKRKFMVLLKCQRPQSKSPLWSALPWVSYSKGPAKEGREQFISISAPELRPQGRGWVCATEAAIEDANALNTAVSVSKLSLWGPTLLHEYIGKSRDTQQTLQRGGWSQTACMVLRLGQRALAMVFNARTSPTHSFLS